MPMPALTRMSIDVDGFPVGAIDDGYGRAALLELGDPSGLTVDGPVALPSLEALLPPTDGARVQLIVALWPARTRVLVAVNVLRAGDPVLISAIRRVRRKLDGQPLTAEASAAALAELAATSATYVTAQRTAGGAIRAVRSTGAMPRKLPLGGIGGPGAALAGLVAGHDPVASAPVASAADLAAMAAPVPAGGLRLGVNRHGTPIMMRPFRTEPTTLMAVGGLRGAQLLVARAAALGVSVTIQSGRYAAWQPLIRALGGAWPAVLVPPGEPVEPPDPASAQHPQLVVVDSVPVPIKPRPWRTALVVRDQLSRADLDLLAGADLALLQPMAAAEANLAASALGLGDSAAWLTRIRGDMVGAIARVPAGGRAVRWAMLAPTPAEEQMIGLHR